MATQTGYATAVVQAVQRSAVPTLPSDVPQELWIYKANSQGYPGSGSSFSSCATNCIKYTYNPASKSFVASPGGGGWPASTHQVCTQPYDEIGVYVKLNHHFVTRLFGADVTLTDHAVFRFEPVAELGSAAPDAPPHAPLPAAATTSAASSPVWIAIMMVVLLGFAGWAVDFSHWNDERTQHAEGGRRRRARRRGLHAREPGGIAFTTAQDIAAKNGYTDGMNGVSVTVVPGERQPAQGHDQRDREERRSRRRSASARPTSSSTRSASTSAR